MSKFLGPIACVSLLTTSMACACVLLLRMVIVPALADGYGLVDANMAVALLEPIHLRVAEIVAVSCIALMLLLPRWSDSRLAVTLNLVGFVGACGWRILLLPEVYAAWSRVDLVAARPLERVLDAQALAGYERWLSLAVAAVLFGVAWFGLRGIKRDLHAAGRSPIAVRPASLVSTGTAEVRDVKAA